MLYIVGLGGEVGTRSRMCMEVGRCGYMGVLLFYFFLSIGLTNLMIFKTFRTEEDVKKFNV